MTPNIFSGDGRAQGPVRGHQAPNATMAEKKTTYCSPSLHVHGINPQAALQLEAIRQGDGELAILLNSKKGESIKAASTYNELKYVTEEANFEHKITLDLHKQELMERQIKVKQEGEKEKLKALPEYVTMPGIEERK